jgi:hypothetical protein
MFCGCCRSWTHLRTVGHPQLRVWVHMSSDFTRLRIEPACSRSQPTSSFGHACCQAHTPAATSNVSCLLLHAPAAVSSPYATPGSLLALHTPCHVQAQDSSQHILTSERCPSLLLPRWALSMDPGSPAWQQGSAQHRLHVQCTSTRPVCSAALISKSHILLSKALSHHTQPPVMTPSSQWVCCG